MKAMPASSRLRERRSPTFGMSAVISSGPSLVSRATQVSSSMWIVVKRSSSTTRSEMQDRVLEVVAVPRHERDQHVLAERELAQVGRRTVRQHVAARDLVAGVHQRTLVDAGVLVRARVLRQVVDVDAGFVGRRSRRRSRARRCATRRPSRPRRRAARPRSRPSRRPPARSMPVPTSGVSRTQRRHGLALHVRAHQRAVRVVVLEERDQRRRDRHDLLRRDVHVLDFGRRHAARTRSGSGTTTNSSVKLAVRRPAARSPARSTYSPSSIADR